MLNKMSFIFLITNEELVYLEFPIVKNVALEVPGMRYVYFYDRKF
jgi:hypothetical protein